MRIRIGNFHRGLRVDRKRLTLLLGRALKGRDGEVSVAIVTRQRIRAVNQQYLGRNRETDVIAFDLADPIEKKRRAIVGEIVVSGDRSRSEAKRRGHSPQAELAFYVAHGALHLLGMDDGSAADAAAMHKAAIALVNQAGYTMASAAGSLLED